MAGQPQTNLGGGPNPAPSTDKLYYQSRKGVGPTTTPNMPFPSTLEGAQRAMDGGAVVMPYSEINSMSPTAEERGIPSDQRRMGG